MVTLEAGGVTDDEEQPTEAMSAIHRRRRPAASLLAVASLVMGLAATSVEKALADEQLPKVDAASELIRRTLGVYPGRANSEMLRSLERELGFDLGVIVQFGGRSSPGDLTGSINGQLARLSNWIIERNPAYSVTIPLAFGYADAKSEEGRGQVVDNLDRTVAGEHDRAYVRVAELLVGAGLGDAVLRLGHEFDGNWFPWSARPSCESFINAFQHVADIFVAVSPSFRIEWSGTLRYFPAWGECAYPGDDYVDILGLDVYDRGGPMSAFSPSDQTWIDPARVWSEQFLPLLELHHEFARDHGKPVSYPEWAIVTESSGAYGGDNPTFIRGMAAWLRSLPTDGPGSLTYHAYFLGVSEYDFRPHEQSAEAFVEEFGTGSP